MPLSATLTLKNITIGYIANKIVKDHYGVPGSPVWYVPEDIEVVSVEILGVDILVNEIPLDLYNELLILADEIDTKEWEQY